MNIGFIGVGNMASAIINGFISEKAVDPGSIFISARTPESTLEKAQLLKVSPAASHQQLLSKADLIILAVKPEQMDAVIAEIKPYLSTQTIVSIAAKKTIQDLGLDVPVIRIMPNLNVTIKQGICALCCNEYVRDDVKSAVIQLFETLGAVVELDEALFSAFIGIAGSSPSFVFKFIDALIQPAIAEGMDQDTAQTIACIAVSGSAMMLKHSELSAVELVNKVSSKGGTTIEGTRVLDERDFDQSVSDAVKATIRKDKGQTRV